MTLNEAIDLYVADMRSAGRINSPRTEATYRRTLELHSHDIGNRDPRTVGREDCKRTLARWANPNSQRSHRSILVSFYRWTVEEGIRPANPAEQTRRPKKRPTSVYRLTRTEVAAMLDAAGHGTERRAIHLGLGAGLRSQELRGLQGRHFEREGWIWVSADIAKGQRERWVPVIEDAAAAVREIRLDVPRAHHVLPGTHRGGFGDNTIWREIPERAMSSQVLQRLVHRVAKRAGISAHIHPHLLRHAFADHVARSAGALVAQALLGHADLGTTQGYLGAPTLEELLAGVRETRLRPTPLDEGTPARVRRGRDSNPRSWPGKAQSQIPPPGGRDGPDPAHDRPG